MAQLSNENKKNTVFLYIFTGLCLVSTLLNSSSTRIISHDYIVYGLVIGVLGIIIIFFRFDYKKIDDISIIAKHIHLCSTIMVFGMYIYFEHLITFIVFSTAMLIVNWFIFLLGRGSKYGLSSEEFKLLKKNIFPAMYVPVIGLVLVEKLYINRSIEKKTIFIILVCLLVFSALVSYRELKKIIKKI